MAIPGKFMMQGTNKQKHLLTDPTIRHSGGWFFLAQ